MTIEKYLKLRNNGNTVIDIQEESGLSEATVYTFELGYQCYLKKMPLSDAINIILRS